MSDRDVRACQRALRDQGLPFQIEVFRHLLETLPENVRDMEVFVFDWRTKETPQIFGWFPEHADNMACPRGHLTLEEEDYVQASLYAPPMLFVPSSHIHSISQEEVEVWAEPESLEDAKVMIGSPDVHFECNHCFALWPVQGSVDLV